MTIGEFIEKRRKELGITLDEIGKMTGVGKSTVKKWETGLISNMGRDKIANLSKILKVSPAVFINDSIDDYNEAINMSITNRSKSIRIPLLNYASIYPALELKQTIGYEEISEELNQQGDFFALKIKDSSMRPRFFQGDTVIVKRQTQVEYGDIVVVDIADSDYRIRKYYRSNLGIHLIPLNSDYAPEFYPYEDIKSIPVLIVGKVVELRARF